MELRVDAAASQKPEVVPAFLQKRDAPVLNLYRPSKLTSGAANAEGRDHDLCF